jgi:hypothetical protein
LNDATASPPEAGTRKSIYAAIFTGEEGADFDTALAMEGLTEEIAALRVRLKAAFKEKKPDLRILTQAMNALVRAVATQYRLSPKARKDLAENVAALVNSLGDQLLPPDR